MGDVIDANVHARNLGPCRGLCCAYSQCSHGGSSVMNKSDENIAGKKMTNKSRKAMVTSICFCLCSSSRCSLTCAFSISCIWGYKNAKGGNCMRLILFIRVKAIDEKATWMRLRISFPCSAAKSSLWQAWSAQNLSPHSWQGMSLPNNMSQ